MIIAGLRINKIRRLMDTFMRLFSTIMAQKSKCFTGLAQLPHIAIADINRKGDKSPQERKDHKKIFQCGMP